MGVIGTGLYDDDTAADVRDSWRNLVASGIAASEATTRLEAEWASQLSDPDVGGPFWLALADTQWKAGLLEPRVLDRARAVLSGTPSWAGGRSKIARDVGRSWTGFASSSPSLSERSGGSRRRRCPWSGRTSRPERCSAGSFHQGFTFCCGSLPWEITSAPCRYARCSTGEAKYCPTTTQFDNCPRARAQMAS
jgi:hypothetical protein